MGEVPAHCGPRYVALLLVGNVLYSIFVRFNYPRLQLIRIVEKFQLKNLIVFFLSRFEQFTDIKHSKVMVLIEVRLKT